MLKALESPKLSKKVKFEGVWGELGTKKCFQRQSNRALREKFSFCFSKVFLLVSTKIYFRQEYWALGYPSMSYRHFPDVS